MVDRWLTVLLAIIFSAIKIGVVLVVEIFLFGRIIWVIVSRIAIVIAAY